MTTGGVVQKADSVPASSTLPGGMLARRPGKVRYVRFGTDGNQVTARFEKDGRFEPVFEVGSDGSLEVVGCEPSRGSRSGKPASHPETGPAQPS